MTLLSCYFRPIPGKKRGCRARASERARNHQCRPKQATSPGNNPLKNISIRKRKTAQELDCFYRRLRRLRSAFLSPCVSRSFLPSPLCPPPIVQSRSPGPRQTLRLSGPVPEHTRTHAGTSRCTKRGKRGNRVRRTSSPTSRFRVPQLNTVDETSYLPPKTYGSKEGRFRITYESTLKFRCAILTSGTRTEFPVALHYTRTGQRGTGERTTKRIG